MSEKIDRMIKNVLIIHAKEKYPNGIMNIHKNMDNNFTVVYNKKTNKTMISYWFNDHTMSTRIISLELKGNYELTKE